MPTVLIHLDNGHSYSGGHDPWGLVQAVPVILLLGILQILIHVFVNVMYQFVLSGVDILY
jgi:hypothetical protein